MKVNMIVPDSHAIESVYIEKKNRKKENLKHKENN